MKYVGGVAVCKKFDDIQDIDHLYYKLHWLASSGAKNSAELVHHAVEDTHYSLLLSYVRETKQSKLHGRA